MEFRMKNIDETINYLIEEVKQNKLMNKKQQKDYLLILAVTVTECVSISAFSSLAGISIGFGGSAVGMKICATTV